MSRKLKGQHGMTLVEATIILMVLSLLTAVFAPSIADYVNDAKDTKVKEDLGIIGTAIIRTVRDSQVACLVSTTPGNGCTLTNRVELLRSDGANPSVDATLAPDFTPPLTTTTTTPINWAGDAQAPTGANLDEMEDQFIKNAPLYTGPSGSYAKGGPGLGLGWRGAYVDSPMGADPWGFRYQSNTVFVNVANNAAAGTGEGQQSGGWHHDLIVISAGRNGLIETPFATASGSGAGATVRGGDDVVYIVSGSTR